MKKIILLGLLLLPCFAFGCVQTLDLSHRDIGNIYLTGTKLQPINKPDHYHMMVNSMVCNFTTKYDGNVAIILEQDASENFKISKNHSYVYKYKDNGINPHLGYIRVTNFGCDTMSDGDKCVQAIEKHLDNVHVVCVSQDN